MYLKSSGHLALALVLANVLVLLQFAQTSNCLRFWPNGGGGAAGATTTTPTPQAPLAGTRQKGDSPADPAGSLAAGQQDDLMRPSKPNKVSKVLHFLHKKSKAAVYAEEPGEEEEEDNEDDHQENKDQAKDSLKDTRDDHKVDREAPDDEIIRHICDRKPSKTCRQALALALKSGPETKARIARAFRTKPAHVNATKLLLLKLFETSIDKLESKGYDEKLDKMIDLAAARNPYLFAATKAYDLLGAASGMVAGHSKHS